MTGRNPSKHPPPDARRQRTRGDLLAAFFSLVLSRRYHEIRIADVLERADVARSTFYEHFRNKDDLLAASLEGPFGILAAMVDDESPLLRVQGILEHFWQNRSLARSLFHGVALRVVRKTLVLHVEDRLGRECKVRLRIPPRLAAHALADGMLSPIIAWLSGEARCTASDLSIALADSTRASVRALQVTE